MPRLNRRQSHSTPPTSSRDVNGDRYSKSRYASSETHRRSGRKTHPRASSVDSRDTYYDPRDKYYLSGDDEDDHVPRREPAFSPSKRGRSPSRSRSRYRARSLSASSRTPSPYSDDHHRRRRSPSVPSRSPSPPPHHPRSTGGRVRDRDTRRNSSPRSRRHHTRRSYSRSPSPSPSRSRHQSPKSALALAQEAAQHAFEAGAIAALRLRDDPSPWLGKKGGQIAAAALSAAVVDTFVARRHPNMRKGGLRHSFAKQAAQMVIGGLMGGNDKGAGKGKKRRAGRMGARGRR
ncbi:hypothetical protein N657DRAFT_642812 [Parathielavia appendiculata]|uniref:Uncharacterized protein n=1 Tax=Parathielavia appendiculata TaxID=2587402 RepID=A0AAN6Z5K3_9PEZI|nr:hypothetical protein N657DRAFT_642812 [Parathielavia appendiculata]